MTNPPAVFWSGETLSERLKTMIDPFAPERVDCAAYTLSIGPEVYVSPNDQTADPTTVTMRQLGEGEAFTIPPASSLFCSPRRSSRCRPMRWLSYRSAPRPSSAAWSMCRDSMSIPAIVAS